MTVAKARELSSLLGNIGTFTLQSNINGLFPSGMTSVTHANITHIEPRVEEKREVRELYKTEKRNDPHR